MVWSACAPGCACSLISWLFISQSGHTIYQIKAEYLNYRMVLVKGVLGKGVQNICIKEYKDCLFFPSFLLS